MNTRPSSNQATGHNAAVVSLHFSPAFISHMTAYAKLLGELGYAITFILDEEYLRFPVFAQNGTPVLSSGAVPEDFEIALFCNSAPRNPQFASRLKAGGTTVLYVYHEPLSVWDWKSLSQEGWRQIVRYPFSAFFSARLLSRSAAIIVPSRTARSEYEANYARFNSNVFELPLLFDDELGGKFAGPQSGKRTHFGFIGSASRGHGFDKFVEFAKYAIRNGSTIPFAVATRRDLSVLLREDDELSQYVAQGRIVVQYGRVLTNEEINQYYLDSFCTWNAYRRSTQSGVLPRSYMAGTPVLASRVGSFPEFVLEGTTGEFVNFDDPLSRFLDLAESIRELFSVYTTGCRTMFQNVFCYKAHLGRFARILDASTRAPISTQVPAHGIESVRPS